MKNILTTIPKSKFPDWPVLERILKRCDGESDYGKEGSEWLWFIRTNHLPKAKLDGAVCFILYDGSVRGYFHIISSGSAQQWVEKGYLMEDKPSTGVIVLANFVALPRSEQVDMRGFQGWRYTSLRP